MANTAHDTKISKINNNKKAHYLHAKPTYNSDISFILLQYYFQEADVTDSFDITYNTVITWLTCFTYYYYC